MGELLSAILIAVMVSYLIYMTSDRPYDDTDDETTETRSGLTLYIDHGTGCEYIASNAFGQLHPRLDKNGNHICREK
jgi:hypothetical protein